jgi:hypothetical protein
MEKPGPGRDFRGGRVSSGYIEQSIAINQLDSFRTPSQKVLPPVVVVVRLQARYEALQQSRITLRITVPSDKHA